MAKRTRAVFPTREIAHLWAHRAQTSARNAQCNHRFDGEVIYSYAEPLARLYKAPGGADVVLYRNRSWSRTTNRHQSFVRRAASHLQVFTVAELRTSSYSHSVPHKANLKAYQARIDEAALVASRARANAEWKLQRLNALVDEANRYAAAFRLTTRFEASTPERLAELTERAALEAKKAERQRVLSAQRQAAREAAERLEAQTHLAQWLVGDRSFPPYRRYIDGDYLRVVGDEVETTQGVRVPLAHAQRALPIVRRLLDRAEAYQRNGHTIHLGHYALDSIDADGTTFAGCHRFTGAEIRRFCDVLAALPPAPVPAEVA